MKKRISTIFMSMLIVSVTTLSGCTEGETFADEAVYPESVQDGTVSVEYYNQLQKYHSLNIEYLKVATQMLNIGLEHKSLSKDDEEYKRMFRETLQNYDEMLLGVNISPKTDADREIEEALNIVISNQLEHNSLLLKNLEERDVEILAKIANKANSWIKHTEELKEIEKRYQLFD